jgi:hypothetical protein
MDEEGFFEQFYERVILPRYADTVDVHTITWKDHGKIDLDAWAHYFDDRDGNEYILLYEDYPSGSFLADGLSHEVVKCGNEASLELKFGDNKQLTNIAGWFTLYREIRR